MQATATSHVLVVVLVLGALMSLAACAANVVLHRRPELDTGMLGPLVTCKAGEKLCQEDTSYDSSVFNPSNATFFSLPDCPYGIRDIVIRDAASSSASVVARCAAPDMDFSGDEDLPATELGDEDPCSSEYP